MKFASRVKESIATSTTSAAVLTLMGAVTNFRALSKAIAAGKLALNDTTVFTVEDSAGNWEESLYKIDSTTQLTRQSVISSSADGAAVVFPSTTTKVVYNTISGDYATSLLSTVDGTTIGQLSSLATASILDTMLLEIFDPASGNSYNATVASLRSLFGAGTSVATGVTMTGPTGGVVSTQSSNFTVGVTPVGGSISGTVTVTPSDNGGGGSFTPATVSLTSAAPTATFKYTPSATPGARTISVTNSGSLTNPVNITYTSTNAAATAYTVTGPSSGSVSVTSGTFTVAANGTLSANVVVTPSDNGGGGSFNPTTVTLTSSATTGTFTYTPNSTAGAKTISFTNSGTLTNAANVTYTTSAAQAITVNTPASPQVVGTPFTVSGTYVNGTPTALQYHLSDDAGGVWTDVASPTISGGTFSFSQNPASASAGRTISVRDKTTLVSGTSGSYTVNAATQVYTITPYTAGNSVPTSLSRSNFNDATGTWGGSPPVNRFMPPKQTVMGGTYWNFSPATASNANVRCGWSLDNTKAPAEVTTNQNSVGSSSVNGLVPMGTATSPSWVNQGYLWTREDAPSGPWYFWIRVGTEDHLMNPSGMMVT